MNGLVAAPLQFCADRRFAGAGNAFDQIVSDAHQTGPSRPLAGRLLVAPALLRRVRRVHDGTQMRHVLEAWWLPFLDTYRIFCFAPSVEFRRVLEEIREMGLGDQAESASS